MLKTFSAALVVLGLAASPALAQSASKIFLASTGADTYLIATCVRTVTENSWRSPLGSLSFA